MKTRLEILKRQLLLARNARRVNGRPDAYLQQRVEILEKEFNDLNKKIKTKN